ncbi:M23 family metallopeptidase [Campylobacter sp. MIT 21-1685]|uniref:M23 family metallopeptidase n=1 Tax=unclassified Campylobacter TaxID=2593542 RepID=UPI00224A95D5|nr:MULTISPECIES: M23 family metallopeptidase [unclassified Campylobacter]MCX2682703.1 M23 family metallopeptidase [Campylobacter sp. MIT 21-1684]MCX2750983.1 M23 family metallopeptidase [Campylobacter sp. MIT 21-1682]MCX2807084.1 M23 family metallopeptidase [Campylobacter sp. MIT 21-1685]
MIKNKLFRFFIFLIVLVLLSVFLNSQFAFFKRTAPQILVSDTIYTNLKTPLIVRVKDNSSPIKNVKITLRKDNDNTSIVLADEKNIDKTDINLQITLPKLAYQEKTKFYILDIQANNSNLFNFLMPNTAKKQMVVVIDEVSPAVKILSSSYQIEKGGAASVVFQANDENLDKVFIQTNTGKIFKVQPFIKEGYYAALVAWNVKDENFNASIIAQDKAGNISKQALKYFLLNRNYRVSTINLTDTFLNGKIKTLSKQYDQNDSNFTHFENFKFVNETLRLANEELIYKITSQIDEEKIENFDLNLFLPLKNSQKVADFADHRFYSYNGQAVSSSYHMGIDLASTAKAPIISNNKAKVVFAEENGIYGLSAILYHGFGIYTLYSHCSSLNVSQGDKIEAQSVIAKTGVSGLALGDHLHFGVLIQGIETRPEQWQDRKWIENSITKVLDKGKKIILNEDK